MEGRAGLCVQLARAHTCMFACVQSATDPWSGADNMARIGAQTTLSALRGCGWGRRPCRAGPSGLPGAPALWARRGRPRGGGGPRLDASAPLAVATPRARPPGLGLLWLCRLGVGTWESSRAGHAGLLLVCTVWALVARRAPRPPMRHGPGGARRAASSPGSFLKHTQPCELLVRQNNS